MLTEKLLIVDDQGELRRMLRIALGYGKYQMFEAEDGSEAVSIARKETPDVVLLDVMMPGELDGFDVCRTLKSDPAFGNPFVILVTALGNPEKAALGRQAGADAYVVKPFRISRLIEIVEQRQPVAAPVTAYAE